MTRKKIEVGIDLGTTNSSAAVVVNGIPEIVPNIETNANLTPSCVAVNSRGELEVGMNAINTLTLDPQNAAEGFKRYIGKTTTWTFSGTNDVYNAEQLSGLLLRSIKRDVQTYLNKDVESAIITIPAVFGELERSATLSAATAAGFSYVELVTEPVAAGLSYGWADSADTRPFLVYDIGGGTFDAAIVHTEHGLLSVRASRGDHALGGRDMDRAILNKIIIPQIDPKIDSSQLHFGNKKLMGQIEEAKIRLSRLDSTVLTFEGSVTDKNGQPVTSTMTISRKDLAAIIEPIADRTFEVVDELLRETGLHSSELKAIVLVGGPTRLHSIREALAEKYDAQLETRVDPMTVVSRGAALHAASQYYESEDNRQIDPDVQSLRIEVSGTSDQPTVPVGIIGEGSALQDEYTLRITRDDGLWQTGQIPIQDGRVITQVSMASSAESRFTIDLVSPDGRQVPVNPAEFSILSGPIAAASPFSTNIGVSVATTTGPRFNPMIRRNDSRPITVVQHFSTMKGVQAGDPEIALEVHFLEGLSDKPQRCKTIGIIALTGEHIDRALPATSEIIVTLNAKASDRIHAVVQIPLFGITLQEEFQLTYDDTRGVAELMQRITLEDQVASRLEESGVILPLAAQSLRRQISEDLQSAESGDIESAIRAEHASSRLGEILEEVEQASESHLAVSDLKAAEEFAQKVVESFGDEIQKEQLQDLAAQAQAARNSSETSQIRKMEEDLSTLAMNVYWDQPGAWMAKFHDLVQASHFVDQNKATLLIEEGNSALEKGDNELLKSIVIELWNLAEESDREGPEAKLMWLRRI